MFNNPDNDLMPELKDLLNRIKAFNISHKQGCFLFSFVGFEENKDEVCNDCGGNLSDVSDSKTVCGAYGDLDILREMTNHIRDSIEDTVSEEGFVSF